MTAKRKRHKPEFKAQVALEAYKGDIDVGTLYALKISKQA